MLLRVWVTLATLTASISAMQVAIIGATGGLGRALVLEALERGHSVSVLVRDRAKLDAVLGEAVVSRLASVFVGDAHDPPTVRAAVAGQEVVFGARGADDIFARVVADETQASGAHKFVFVAGLTNVMSEDGVTPNYVNYVKYWSGAEAAYQAHSACIDAIKESGVPYVILCPGFMKSLGSRSPDLPDAAHILVNRPNGNFVSYEDAAFIMLEAAEGDQWDGQLITASTRPPEPEYPVTSSAEAEL
jgi:uncharacterized protein YbjT (DUF2867 family)